MSTWPQRRARKIRGVPANKLHRAYAAVRGRDKRALQCELKASELVPKRNAAFRKIPEGPPSGQMRPASER